jgi:hypothetical protein
VRHRPPSSVKKPGSSSRELGSPPEFVVPTSARASKPCLRTTHDHGRLPWGSPTSSRHQPCESTYRRASQAHLRSALSVSRALDGLLLALPCRLVSSCCHVQVSRSRGFLPRTSRTTSSVARPSSPLAAPACHRLPDDASRHRVDLEVLIRSEIRSTREGFSPARYPSPLVRFAPSGFAPPVLETSLLSPPLGL